MILHRFSVFYPVLSLVGALAFSRPVAAATGSLWRDESARALVSDTRARQVGDIVTVVVQESNEAAKANNTKTAKKTGINASIAAFFTKEVSLKSDKSFEGGGTINNSETINARIAVRVAEVLPNGNLVLEGRRSTSVAGEQQEAVLRGVIRQEDIQPNNTVFSFNIVDATIKFVSKGSVTDSQRRGWFSRAFDKVTPF
jgi:flagellar L-ring protein FlgH